MWPIVEEKALDECEDKSLDANQFCSCVLATASENYSKGQEIIKYNVPNGLFGRSGFGFRVGTEEIDFLKKLEE